MKHEISNLLLAQFSEFVAAHMGLHFPAERWADLRRGIRSAAPEFGYTDEVACVKWLLSAPLTRPQIEILAGNLTVGETYFFRENRVFELLTERILPELIQSRRGGEPHLRFWSAACCTGEEAYSLAITLRRSIPDLKDWKVTILATDVNPRFLQKAASGVFGEWSFRNAPVWLKQQYFQCTESGQYVILPEIRRMVQFEHLNLAEDTYPSLLTDTNAMDLILCRNVLMYFAPAQSQRAVAQLQRCLVEGGWLALSATETAIIPPRPFAAVNLDGAILYRKCERPVEPVIPPAPLRLWQAPVTEPSHKPSLPPAPDGPEMIRMTRKLANEGRLAEALTWADRLVLAEKLSPLAHYLRAMIRLEQGALPDASRALQRAVFLDQNFVIAHFSLGTLALGAGKIKAADKHFTNALHLLDRYDQNEILPESEGMTAGRLAEMINSMRDEALAS